MLADFSMSDTHLLPSIGEWLLFASASEDQASDEKRGLGGK